MQAQITTLRSNCVYLIENRKTRRFLSADLTSKSACDSKVTLKQLWVLIKKEGEEYQIMQMVSGDPLAWTQPQQNTIRSLRRKMTQTDRDVWSIREAQVVNGETYYWITPNSTESRCLHSSSIHQKVKVSSIDPTLSICLWRFKEFDLRGESLHGIATIQSTNSKYAMASSINTVKQDAEVNLQQMRTYGNQLWLIEPHSSTQQPKQRSFTIRNFYSRLLLTLIKTSFGFRIVQRCYSNLENQRWTFEMCNEHRFYIKSAAQDSVYLGFSSEKKGQKVIAQPNEKRKQWLVKSNILSVPIQKAIKTLSKQ